MNLVYRATVPQLQQMLSNLELWLDQAVELAQAKEFEPDRFLGFRLAPDQFSLAQQVRSACDNAKFAVARSAGKEAPKHADNETTMEELRSRIRTVKEYIGGFQPEDFEGAEERVVTTPIVPGKGMFAPDYLNGFALPNFYFHLSMTYAILRHNGVPLGKKVFIGSLKLFDV